MNTLWIITYDIQNNKIRNCVHKTLKNYGLRVQYSVFECRLNPTQQQSLQQNLTNIIEKADKIRWYPLCKSCESHTQWQGIGNATDTNLFYIV